MRREQSFILAVAGVMSAVVMGSLPARPAQAAAPEGATFEKVRITEEYLAEGAGFGDFNHDGTMDVVCGPYWFAGPDYKARHPFSKGGAFPNNKGYSDVFFSYGYDFNGDGWVSAFDISIVLSNMGETRLQEWFDPAVG